MAFRGLSFTAVRLSITRTNIVLSAVLIINVLLLCVAIDVMIQELEKRIVPIFITHPVVSGKLHLKGAGAVKTAGAPATAAPEHKSAEVRTALCPLENADVFSRYGGLCEAEVVSRGRDAGGYVKLDYNVSSPLSSSEYICAFDAASFREYAKLVLELKGATGEEVFKIRMRNGETYRSVSVNTFFPSGVPRSWQQISIPLASLSGPADKREASGELALVFEYGQGMPYKGTIYVNDIRFLH